VTSLNNGEKLTFVTSIGCGVAQFDAGSGNCFGEEWMEIGTPTSSRGACAFVGPTWGNTHTKYNNAIDKGLYVAMFQEGLETPAQTLLRGKIRMYSLYGGGDSQVLWHFRTYTVLGDPSTHIWKEVPRKLAVTYSPSISIGYDQVEVTVLDSATLAPVSGAQVCIAGDSVYATDTTDASGMAIVSVESPMLDTLSLVVRGGRVVPMEGTVLVTSDQEHVAPLGDPVVIDLDGNLDGRVNPNEHIQIAYMLKNWGAQPATNVQATLSAPDTTHVSIVHAGPVSYGTLPPNTSGGGSGTPLQFYVKTNTPVGSQVRVQLNVTSTSRSWSYLTDEPVFGCDLQLVSVTINDQGSVQGNGRLDPGETAIMYATITNNGQDVAPGVVGTLRCTPSPYIRILDSIGTFGALTIGGSSTNTTNSFTISAADTCPIGSTFVLTLQLATTGGQYAYSVQREFSLVVGLPSGTDPTGPDAYGYYAYSTDDSLYEQAPVFDWVEIRDVGTRVPYVSPGDFTATATLPFTFRYYGRSFTSLRVSSDGWMAFGSGTQVAYTNYSLPHVDNIRNMVGLFWDDLFESNNNPTSKLLYHSDPANHRFIVEWDSVGHYGGTTLRETFQAILLDPAYYPTPTGDGEILFQYRVVGEEGACTIGTEDSTQTIGMQYLYNGAYNPTASDIRDDFAIRFTTHPPSIGSTSITVSVPIMTAWNLISNPVLRPDSMNVVRRLYPNSTWDYVFQFTPGSGYSQSPTMQNGPGFWGKFPGGELNTITGLPISADSIPVSAGWNLIGSISVSVETSLVVTDPPGIRSSRYFGYSAGYIPVMHLDPGLGYWVKASSPGLFILRPAFAGLRRGSNMEVALAGINTLTISDERGGAQSLYFASNPDAVVDVTSFEMPPLPPEGAFDARFESEEGGTMMKVFCEDGTHPIGIRSSGRLKIWWHIVDGNSYHLIDGSSRLITRSMSGDGSAEIDFTKRLFLQHEGSRGLPREYELSQNFPNPFNPATVIKYALPVESKVTISVCNLLGQRVKTIVNNETQAAAFRSVVWDGTTVSGAQAASGVYFARLDARGVNGETFLQVRKMLLVK
jgi:hypothetical protein